MSLQLTTNQLMKLKMTMKISVNSSPSEQSGAESKSLQDKTLTYNYFFIFKLLTALTVDKEYYSLIMISERQCKETREKPFFPAQKSYHLLSRSQTNTSPTCWLFSLTVIIKAILPSGNRGPKRMSSKRAWQTRGQGFRSSASQNRHSGWFGHGSNRT